MVVVGSAIAMKPMPQERERQSHHDSSNDTTNNIGCHALRAVSDQDNGGTAL